VEVHEVGKINATPFELNTTNGECIAFSSMVDRNTVSNKGILLGAESTRRKIHFETVDAMRVRNNKITEHSEYVTAASEA